jgi:isopenicillin N synthase-like dioxygenase
MDRAITLERLELADIEKVPGSTGNHLVDKLKKDRALFIRVSHYNDVHEESARLSRLFFALPQEEKHSALGVHFFRRHCGDLRLSTSFLGETYCASAAELFGKERGWVPTGESNTKVRKEYFQFGFEVGAPVESRGNLIQNVWPLGDFGRYFKRVKLRHLDLFCTLHLAIFRAMSRHFFNGCSDRFHTWPANILCRDTHYLPQQTSCEVGINSNYHVRNLPHIDLGEGTLIKVENGLQIYTGRCTDAESIFNDVAGWKFIDESGCSPDDLLYIPGLALEIRSGGKIPATWHRVVAETDTGAAHPRYSIVSFGNAGTYDILAPFDSRRDERQAYAYIPIQRDHLPIIGNGVYVGRLQRGNAAVNR